jgi:hypothetical protein
MASPEETWGDEPVTGAGWSRVHSSKVPPINGVVSGLREHTERQRSRLTTTVERVLTFRVERRDSIGRPLPAVPIEMRGAGFDGVLNEGDAVQLPGRFAADTVLKIERLVNLTSGDAFCTKGPPLSSVVIGLAAVVVLAAVLVGVFVHFLLSGSGF